MNVNYELVAWLVELFYNFFHFSDGVMLWAALLPVALLLLYSALCVCLIPFSVIHRAVADARRGIFSLPDALTAALYCYPVLLPWVWNCKSQHSYLRTVYYILIHMIWFTSVGLSSWIPLIVIHEAVMKSGSYPTAKDGFDAVGVYETIMFAILANVMIVYSIVLLVWQHRFDDKQSAKADVNAPVKIYYHPSVMLSLWFVVPILMYLAVGWGFPVDMILVSVMYVLGEASLVWIGISCYLMIQKERRFRREIENNGPSARRNRLGGLTETDDIASPSVHDVPN